MIGRLPSNANVSIVFVLLDKIVDGYQNGYLLLIRYIELSLTRLKSAGLAGNHQIHTSIAKKT